LAALILCVFCLKEDHILFKAEIRCFEKLMFRHQKSNLFFKIYLLKLLKS